MTGTRPTTLVLQPRDRALLRELATLRVLDRDHARLVAGFRSRTRVNARVLRLTHAGLLTRLPVGTLRGGHKYLYALTRRGAGVIEAPYRPVPWSRDTVLAGHPFLEHQLRLNTLLLSVRFQVPVATGIHVRSWRTFLQPLTPAIRLIPDAYLELARASDVHAVFVEMDLGTEPLRTWERKIDRYLQLATTGAFAALFPHRQFRVWIIAPSERRLHTIRRVVARRTPKLFWFATFEVLDATRLWAATWWRPTGADRHSPI